MDFVPVHPRIEDHGKTLAVASTLDMDPFEVWPRIVRLWSWAFYHAQDGDVTAIQGAGRALSRILHVDDPGASCAFFAALCAHGWIDDVDGRLLLHDWSVDGAGRLWKLREAGIARKRMSREANADVSRGERGCHTMPREDRTGRDIYIEVAKATSHPTCVGNEKPPEPKPDPIPWERVAETYRTECTRLRGFREWTDERKRKFRALWKSRTGDEADRMEYWRQVCAAANESKNMQGRSWAVIDYVIQEHVKILEGFHAELIEDRKKPGPRANPNQVNLEILE